MQAPFKSITAITVLLIALAYSASLRPGGSGIDRVASQTHGRGGQQVDVTCGRSLQLLGHMLTANVMCELEDNFSIAVCLPAGIAAGSCPCAIHADMTPLHLQEHFPLAAPGEITSLNDCCQACEILQLCVTSVYINNFPLGQRCYGLRSNPTQLLPALTSFGASTCIHEQIAA